MCSPLADSCAPPPPQPSPFAPSPSSLPAPWRPALGPILSRALQARLQHAHTNHVGIAVRGLCSGLEPESRHGRGHRGGWGALHPDPPFPLVPPRSRQPVTTGNTGPRRPQLEGRMPPCPPAQPASPAPASSSHLPRQGRVGPAGASQVRRSSVASPGHPRSGGDAGWGGRQDAVLERARMDARPWRPAHAWGWGRTDAGWKKDLVLTPFSQPPQPPCWLTLRLTRIQAKRPGGGGRKPVASSPHPAGAPCSRGLGSRAEQPWRVSPHPRLGYCPACGWLGIAELGMGRELYFFPPLPSLQHPNSTVCWASPATATQPTGPPKQPPERLVQALDLHLFAGFPTDLAPCPLAPRQGRRV